MAAMLLVFLFMRKLIPKSSLIVLNCVVAFSTDGYLTRNKLFFHMGKTIYINEIYYLGTRDYYTQIKVIILNLYCTEVQTLTLTLCQVLTDSTLYTIHSLPLFAIASRVFLYDSTNCLEF